jgi:hypothetical protein
VDEAGFVISLAEDPTQRIFTINVSTYNPMSAAEWAESLLVELLIQMRVCCYGIN